ncbi:sce7726 family protein [Deinococcus multiflagellatus]|uniref:Sce7726 family protein n=2 Tax=Deinococcus multiflagellatus TaxID=1656887 RepID=A0ABW1ZR37_9DEIO
MALYADPRHYREQGRADLVLLPDSGPSVGVEIKTDRDSLYRCKRQVPLYDVLVARRYLATTPRHIEKALTFLPEAWGVLVLCPDTHAVLEECRAPEPGPDWVTTAYLMRELWSQELIPALLATGMRATPARRMSNGQRAHALLQHHGDAAARALTLDLLSRRTGTRVTATRLENSCQT